MSFKQRLIFELNEPEILSPQDLDHYLATGWDRDAEFLFRQNITMLNGKVCSVVPLRIVLADYAFSKRQRKVLSRSRQFDVEIKPLEIDKSKEALYEKHKVRFKEFIRSNLRDFFYRFSEQSPFTTVEVNIYDGFRLIASSFLDIGETSVYSIYGMFDPAYHKYSLGKLTMLLEIGHAIDTDKMYYYPGHAVDVPSIYDYKMTFPQMEFYNWNHQWKPLEALDKEATPARILRKKLEHARYVLNQHYQLHFEIASNKDFFLYAWDGYSGGNTRTIHSPLYLIDKKGTYRFIGEYQLDRQQYLFTIEHYTQVLYKGQNLLIAGNILAEERKKEKRTEQLLVSRFKEVTRYLSDARFVLRISLRENPFAYQNFLQYQVRGDLHIYLLEFHLQAGQFVLYRERPDQKRPKQICRTEHARIVAGALANEVHKEERTFLQVQQHLAHRFDIRSHYHRSESDFYSVSSLEMLPPYQGFYLRYSIADQLFMLEDQNRTDLHFIREHHPLSIANEIGHYILHGL